MNVAHSSDLADSPVVELRQYTLHPGRRADLVDVFERYLVSGQEAVGMVLGGLFEDEDADDRFVWLRGFADLEQRTRALAAFYGGPVWREHAHRANATMIDSDDVFLLRPTEPPHPPEPAVPRAPAPSEQRVHVGVCLLDGEPDHEPWLVTEVHSVLEDELGTRVATWRSHPGPNGFPALPVRDERAVVWMASFPNAGARDDALARRNRSSAWTGVAGRLRGQELRLRPLASSRHPAPAR